MFVLHGNVRDLAAARKRVEFVPLQQFPARSPFGAPRPGAVLRPRRRPHLSHARDEGRFRSAPSPATTASIGTNFANGLPRNPDGVLNILDNYLRLRIAR